MGTKSISSLSSSDRAVSRGRGWRSLASFAASIAQSPAARRGFSQSILLLHWPYIIGRDLAQISTPMRLVGSKNGRGGVLHIAVDGMHTVLLQHRTPHIIQRVNTYLGWSAIDRVTFRRRASTGPTLDKQS